MTAPGDATWRVGESVVISDRTTVCGMAMVRGDHVRVEVVLAGQPVGSCRVQVP